MRTNPARKATRSIFIVPDREDEEEGDPEPEGRKRRKSTLFMVLLTVRMFERRMLLLGRCEGRPAFG
jgi:hypothetical protein